MKNDLRAVRWEAEGQMHEQIWAWPSFSLTAFAKKVGMPLYLSLNPQLSDREKIWMKYTIKHL